jgi:hypothetical protein
VHRNANRRPRCRVLVAGLHAQRVGALPRFDRRVELPRRVGDLAEDREIGGSQEAVRVCLREELEGGPPLASRRDVVCAPDDGLTGGVGHRTPTVP